MWGSILALLAGEKIKHDAQKDAAKKTDSAMKRKADRQTKLTDDRRTEVLDALTKVNPTAQGEQMQRSQAQSEGQLNSVLQDAINSEFDGSQPTGKVSQTQIDTAAKSKANALKDASDLAALIGKIRAPNDMRFEQKRELGDTGLKTNRLNALSRLYGANDDILIDRAKRVDPRMMTLGSLLSTGGMMYGMGEISNAGNVMPEGYSLAPGATNPGASSVGSSFDEWYARLTS